MGLLFDDEDQLLVELVLGETLGKFEDVVGLGLISLDEVGEVLVDPLAGLSSQCRGRLG